jgi:hypothetical protein
MALANAEFVKPLEPDKKPPGTEMFDRRRPLWRSVAVGQ